MIIHESSADARGAGRWEMGTTRYVPLGGGSRSRLPIGYGDVRRYYGFVGMDEKLTPDLSTIAALYSYLGGSVVLTTETASYIGRLLEQSKKWIKGGSASEAGQ